MAGSLLLLMMMVEVAAVMVFVTMRIWIIQQLLIAETMELESIFITIARRIECEGAIM